MANRESSRASDLPSKRIQWPALQISLTCRCATTHQSRVVAGAVLSRTGVAQRINILSDKSRDSKLRGLH